MAAVAVAAAVVACVCVCVCVVTSLLDHARVATLDRATHSNDCDRSAAERVVVAAVVAVVAACL